jgi:hypothetical protein
MTFNAFVVNWTIEGFAELKQELSGAGFIFEPEGEHMRIAVPSARVEEFAVMCQKRLNAPQNYIDIQYPDERKTVLVFRDRVFVITGAAQNEQVRQWAIARGLPPEQAGWATSFE